VATGINKREKLSADALTAALPHRDPNPLPGLGATARLEYPGRLSEKEIIKPLKAEFVRLKGKTTPTPATLEPNSFVLADNLFALHALAARGPKVDLFYLDPPYATGMGFQSRALEHSYDDHRMDAAYVEFMRRRFILMREAMADHASIYVHIGHQMVSHLKVVMDEVFGADNFRNVITRRKCSSKNFTKHQYANLNDYVLFYTKTDDYKWNQPGEKPSADWIDKEYPKVDAKGRHKLVPVHAPGTRNGATGGLWRGKSPPPGKHWQYVPTKLDEFDRAGEIHWSRNGNPRRKVYLTADKLVPYTDSWTEFRDAHHQSIAVTGYPTEKNLSMMRMIVAASSDPGDLVVDPFCGSGTTLQAAEELGRRWIGVDQSFAAAKATLTRLRHGVQKMGDYVERPERFKDAKVVDLFGGLPSEAQEAAPFRPVEFDFLADKELVEPLGAELTRLALL